MTSQKQTPIVTHSRAIAIQDRQGDGRLSFSKKSGERVPGVVLIPFSSYVEERIFSTCSLFETRRPARLIEMAARKPSPKKSPIQKTKTSDPWSRIPLVREGVLTQVRPNKSVVVIDPQSQKAFLFEGKIAEVWLMMEAGRSSSRIKSALSKGLRPAEKPALDREVQAFFGKLLALKLARPAK